MKSTKWFSITKAFQDSILTEALVTLENSLEISVLFKRVGWRLVSACFSRRAKLPSRIRFLHTFLLHILRLKRIYGAAYVVKYLKACQLAVQKVIAGTPIDSLKELMGDLPVSSLDRRGLPKIIPVYDRRLIRGNSASVIRYWLTLFSLYRIIKIPGQLKLSTITDKLETDVNQVHQVGLKLNAIASNFKSYVGKIDGPKVSFSLLEAASSTSVVSWTGILKDRALLTRNGLDGNIEKLMSSMNLSSLQVSWDLFGLLLSIRQDIDPFLLHKVEGGAENVGQLSIKEEAAGKLRVFALVDVWTQSILKPIHDSLFTFLQSLPNDATFDQGLAVKRCFSKVEKFGKSFGYDLSAATDRLPIDVQVEVMKAFFGSDIAQSWKQLLVDRYYILRSKEHGEAKVKYSVGQPMGALSSWAMLAVTHHLIVQLAARDCNKIPKGIVAWYEQYELLGDDIQLFEEDVATRYLAIMAELGVSINLSKSVIAVNSTFEFAKVTGNNGKDVSALSWKAFISQNSWMGRANILFSLLNRPLGIPNWVSWASAITSHNKKSLDSNTILALWTMFSNSGKVPLTVVLSSLMSVKSATRRSYKDILLNANVQYAILSLSAILKGLPIPVKNLDSFEWRAEESWIKIMLQKPVMVWKYKFNQVEAVSNLSRQMVCYLVPNVPETLNVFTTTFDPLWGDYEQVLNAIFLNFYMLIDNKINRIRGEDGADLIDTTIENISNEIDTMDRVNEILALVERAKAKDAKVAKLVPRVGTPLKIIKTYLKGSKTRPKWTLNVFSSYPDLIRKDAKNIKWSDPVR